MLSTLPRNPILRGLLRAGVWLRRFTRRRGYGIHSPFAFNVVHDVVYERAAYSAYKAPDAERKRRKVQQPAKDDRLMLRLVNDHQPRTALCLTSPDDITLEYLRAGCRASRYEIATELLANENRQYDLLYINTECPPVGRLLTLAGPRTLIVVSALRNRSAYWRELQADERVRVTFDLFDIGLAYTNERLNKQDYIIDY